MLNIFLLATFITSSFAICQTTLNCGQIYDLKSSCCGQNSDYEVFLPASVQDEFNSCLVVYFPPEEYCLFDIKSLLQTLQDGSDCTNFNTTQCTQIENVYTQKHYNGRYLSYINYYGAPPCAGPSTQTIIQSYFVQSGILYDIFADQLNLPYDNICTSNNVICAGNMVYNGNTPRINYPTPGYKLYSCEFSRDNINFLSRPYSFLFYFCKDNWNPPILYNSVVGLMNTDSSPQISELKFLFHNIIIDSLANLKTGLPTSNSLYGYASPNKPGRVSVMNLDYTNSYSFFSSPTYAWLDVFAGSGYQSAAFAQVSPSPIPVPIVNLQDIPLTENNDEGTLGNLLIQYTSPALLAMSVDNVTMNLDVQNFNATFALASELEILRVSFMNLERVNEFIVTGPVLSYVNISNNFNCFFIGTYIFSLPNLHVLDLSYNAFYPDPTIVPNMPYLDYLDLSGNNYYGNYTTLLSGFAGQHLSYLGLKDLSGMTGYLPAGFCADLVAVNSGTPLDPQALTGICSQNPYGCGAIPPCIF